MTVTLTIKHVPSQLAEKLKAIASQNHRSLQGELMFVLETIGKLHDAGTSTQALQDVLATQAATAPRKDTLLEELDALVAGSTLGAEPWLTREQANERPMKINADPQP